MSIYYDMTDPVLDMGGRLRLVDADGKPLQVGRAYPNPVPHDPPDPLLAASQANVRRQVDELRGLVREAIPWIDVVAWATQESARDEYDDWLRRAREAV